MMTKKFSTTKYIILISVFIIGLVSCERDFKDIGIALVDNNKFDTKTFISDIIAYNVSVDSVRVDSLPQYVLGVNQNNTFGKTTASIATQVSLPGAGTDFGVNPTIDSVILNIPYYNTKGDNKTIVDPNSDTNDSIVVPTFELDSIIGNKTTPFTITVSELGTFLNNLDPLDPTKRKQYYSNRSYSTVNSPLFSGLFSPNADDTVSYIKYKDLDNSVFDIDTVKIIGSAPSIKIPLDESFFKNNFLDKSGSAELSSNEEFRHFFRGLYISASGLDGSLLTLPLSRGNITIYYSNDVSTTDTDSVTTISRTKQKMVFSLIGIRTNKFEQDYSLASSSIQAKLLNPDKINGEQKLYIQGASGSEVVLKLFTNDDIENIRSKNWLINEANIKLYIDKNETSNNLPNRLFIYNYDNNSHVIDIIAEGPSLLGGGLKYDDNGDPELYKFRVTDYIANILKQENPIDASNLAVKAYSSYDIPTFVRQSDTIIKPFNWNPKGVAIFGNKELGAKKLSLEIFYTEPKN
jgi:uncharacterized protein DUF4270